jgi:hypothetical protein
LPWLVLPKATLLHHLLPFQSYYDKPRWP